MKLLQYTYKRCDFPKRNDWIMDAIDLQTLNLIVGKNATGKSRVLQIPTIFAQMITQDEPVYDGNWECTFLTRDHKKICYYLSKNATKRIEEQLRVDEQIVLERTGETAKLYSYAKMDFAKITPPDNKLVLHVRRDKAEYPFLEELVAWAEHTHALKFAQIHPTSFFGSAPIEKKTVTIEDIPALFEALPESSKQTIMREFNTLGYALENVYAKSENYEDVLYVQEKGFKHELRQNLLSQGMFRAFTLIVFIQYLIEQNQAQTIIVDDLGEGLDYERATKLGKLLFEKLERHDIQLIASSNDSFLMDVVNIRYWNILRRSQNTLKVYNYANSKDKFENFEYSGLSNFDLFASDYLG